MAQIKQEFKINSYLQRGEVIANMKQELSVKKKNQMKIGIKHITEEWM